MFQDAAAVPAPGRRSATSATGCARPGCRGPRRPAGWRSCWPWSTCPAAPGAGRATLSGGEAQRVALARALAPHPRLLLLDEPFGALDRDLRDRLAVDVRALLHRLGTPAIHVTHDIVEAQLVGDRVVRLADLTGGGCAPV